MRIVTVNTPDGEFHIVIDDNKAILSGFGSYDELVSRLPTEAKILKIDSHPYGDLILGYYQGNFKSLNEIERVQIGTPFQEKVWKTISLIPPGNPISYGQVAKLIGHPNSARAVGTACRKNHLPLIVPCHRVIKSDGTIGNYLYGPKIKQSLLNLESQYS